MAIEARLRIEVGEGEARFAVDAELSLDAGVLVLFGPSGAGKSLTVQALAGLLRPVRGRVAIAGEIVFDSERRVDVPAHRRRVGYVPQVGALFPHLTVAENVAFGLPRHERGGDSARVVDLLRELGLTHLAKARTTRLSGGERQRVALARALAIEPRLVLLDEPFASIDRAGRETLWQTLLATLARRATPAVFVTHDPIEARAVGDRISLFEVGRTTTTGSPDELLGAPSGLALRGETDGAPLDSGAAGMSSVALRDAVLEGPTESIAALRGPVRFSLGETRAASRPREAGEIEPQRNSQQ
jgi:molybdate transport system ATP-binding protein